MLRGLVTVAGGLALGCGWGSVQMVRAQMVGVPVLQSAFLNPGVTLGANFASSSGAAMFGAAAAWVSDGSTIQISGGAGLLDFDSGPSRATWGARAMLPIPGLGTRSVGVAAFAGVGGLKIEEATETRIPVGATIGYRGTLGETRAISAYLAPFLNLSRLKHDSVSERKLLFRVSVGVDVAIMRQLGLTIGYEWGGRAPAGSPGPAGGLFGVGLSYALREP